MRDSTYENMLAGVYHLPPTMPGAAITLTPTYRRPKFCGSRAGGRVALFRRCMQPRATTCQLLKGTMADKLKMRAAYYAMHVITFRLHFKYHSIEGCTHYSEQ